MRNRRFNGWHITIDVDKLSVDNETGLAATTAALSQSRHKILTFQGRLKALRY